METGTSGVGSSASDAGTGRTTAKPGAELIQLSPGNAPLPDAVSPHGQLPEYEAAVRRGSASFAQMAAAVFYSREQFMASPAKRAVYEGYIKPLTEAFESTHGAIVYSFYCQHLIAAAVLTDRRELSVIPPPVTADIAPIAELLFECDRLNVETERVLSGAERLADLQTTKRLIYEIVVKLLTLAEEQSLKKHQISHQIIELHRKEVKRAQDYYLRAAARFAQFDYFRGMLVGCGFPLALIAIGVLLWVLGHELIKGIPTGIEM